MSMSRGPHRPSLAIMPPIVFMINVNYHNTPPPPFHLPPTPPCIFYGGVWLGRQSWIRNLWIPFLHKLQINLCPLWMELFSSVKKKMKNGPSLWRINAMKDLNIATIETFTTWPDGWRGFRKYEGVCAFKLAYSYNSASIFNFPKYDHRFFTNLVFMAFHNSDNVSLHRTPTIAFHFFK